MSECGEKGNITPGREPTGLALTQDKGETEQFKGKLLSSVKSYRNVERILPSPSAH